MRSTLFTVGMASMAAGQVLDFASINAAPSVTQSGPADFSTVEVVVQSAAAIGSAAVTGPATASATASASAVPVVQKRAQLEARTYGTTVNILCSWFGLFCPPKQTTPVQTPTPSKSNPAVQTTPPVTAAASTTISATTWTMPGTEKPTPTGIPSSCTNTWTNTWAFNPPATDCPEIYEVGTYCGFKNPLDPCQDQPAGSGPVASPDTPAAFLANTANTLPALNAKTPSGYAQTFKNLQGATTAASYLGLWTLKSYDVAGCAAQCDSTATCTSFNIYVERDPALNPSTEFCCPNPNSLSNYKCTLWGSSIDASTATNTGETREQFQVVITGSNGYTKANTTTPVTPPGWTNPQKCQGAHSQPTTCIGQKFFPGPFNPQICASYAQAQNIKNGAVTGRGYSSNTCSFFNAYMLKKNKAPMGTFCSLYAQSYSSSLATYIPGWQSGSFWDIETSWSWSISSN